VRDVDDQQHALNVVVGGQQPVHGADHHVPGDSTAVGTSRLLERLLAR
jgi:hypothetical protein